MTVGALRNRDRDECVGAALLRGAPVVGAAGRGVRRDGGQHHPPSSGPNCNSPTTPPDTVRQAPLAVDTVLPVGQPVGVRLVHVAVHDATQLCGVAVGCLLGDELVEPSHRLRGQVTHGGRGGGRLGGGDDAVGERLSRPGQLGEVAGITRLAERLARRETTALGQPILLRPRAVGFPGQQPVVRGGQPGADRCEAVVLGGDLDQQRAELGGVEDVRVDRR